jgi:glycosyltransferase involved in cell wall biosynthesis
VKITVVVTTYNRPEALVKVLTALNEQIRPPDELIVADDGSTESTRRCVEDLKSWSSMPTLHVWQPDWGFRVAKIRNEALRVCTGEYVIFLDGDCIPDPHFVKDHDRLSGRGYFVQGKRILVDRVWSDHFTHRSIAGRRFRLLLSRHLGNRHHLLRLSLLPPLINSRLSGTRLCNAAIFKSDLLAVNGFNEAFQGWGREDSEMVVRLYKYGLKRKEHPFAAVCFHLWHPDNDRTQLAENDRLLAQAKTADTFLCAQGLQRIELPMKPFSGSAETFISRSESDHA